MPRASGWRYSLACAFSLVGALLSQDVQPPSTSAGLDQRGVSLAQSGDFAAAIQQFQAALRLDPSSGDVQYHLALAYDRAGQTDDAIAAYEETLRLHPEILEARYMLAGCCAKRGDTEGELNLLAEVVARKPEFAEARYNYGLALKNQNRSGESLDQLQAAAKLAPNNPKILMALGAALADRESKRAVGVLRDAVRLDPANAETHYNLALVLAANGNDDDAIQEFHNALRLSPNHPSARRGLAVTLIHKGELELASSELRRVLELVPTDAEAANNLGMVELRRKRTAAAIEALERAVHSNPQLIKAHFNLSQAYQRVGRVADARRESDRGAELTAEQRNRGRAMVLLEAAEQARQSGELDASLARLREATAADPNFPEAHLRLGRALRESGKDAKDTISEFRRVLRLDPENAEAHYQIGLTLEETGQRAAALAEFRVAVDMAPCRVEQMQALGRAALNAGQWEVAAAQFRAVLAWRAHDDDARLGFEQAMKQQDRVR